MQNTENSGNNDKEGNKKNICNVPFLFCSRVFAFHCIEQWEPSAQQSPPDKNMVDFLQKKQSGKPGDPGRDKRPKWIGG